MDKKQRVGRYVKCSAVSGEAYFAYIPQNLPPQPAIEMDALYPLLDQANTALGRLDGMRLMLPDESLFLYMYVRKEAVLSSQIEGTQSSLSDLLLLETDGAPGVPMDDVAEVSCYVSAMKHGLERLQEIPLSLRLLREVHAKLMASGRGSKKQPGEFRTSQNWIGGARPGKAIFVPPPPERISGLLGDFEKFLHDKNVKLPALVKAALAHVQFETLHPFLDGNGRLGRLLITLMLCVDGVMSRPLLYLSLYFKTNRQAYYDHLQSVRETGDWEAWIKFFLTGVVDTANQATRAAREILTLFDNDRSRIEGSGRSTASILTISTYLRRHPVSNTARIREAHGFSLPTILRSLAVLEELGIVKEITGKKRHKRFVYQEYLNLLNKGTEPLPR